MKLIRRLFSIMVLLIVLQTGSVYAQMVGAANLAAHGVLALMGGSWEEKQEKIIDKSTTQEKISGSNVTVLRVKDAI